MKTVYIKSRSNTWFARITEQEASIFRINHVGEFAHQLNTCGANIQRWLFLTLAGDVYYERSCAQEYEQARQQFIHYAMQLLSQPAGFGLMSAENDLEDLPW